MKVLCAFGKYQYGDEHRGLSTEYFSFIPAFEELGYEVFHFDSWNSSLYADYADLNSKFLKLHLSDSILHIDFNTDYYYELIDFDTFEQFKYCQKHKQLTIGLLNDNKTDIINKWTTNVNLL